MATTFGGLRAREREQAGITGEDAGGEEVAVGARFVQQVGRGLAAARLRLAFSLPLRSSMPASSSAVWSSDCT